MTSIESNLINLIILLVEKTIRRLGVLQEKKTELVDKYEEVIQNSPLVINEVCFFLYSILYYISVNSF